MADNTAISLTNVSKVFKRYHRPIDRLKEILLPGKQRAQEFWALQNIHLEIAKGDTVGIVGLNGSGKSTLLQIIAKTLQPTTGDVQVTGRVSALLELGSGFNPEFTGRQNVFFNGRILGLSQAEIGSRFADIAVFADIGEFIDQPVKTYSSGMFVRLAFAVAINTDPDILIIDEALSVGDEAFQRKCFARIQDVQDQGATVLFVSHSAASILELCHSAVLIDSGEILLKGLPKEVVSSYQRYIYMPPDIRETARKRIKQSKNNTASTAFLETVSDLQYSSEPLIGDIGITCSGEKTKLSSQYYDPNFLPKSTVIYESSGAVINNTHINNAQGERVNILVMGETYTYQYSVKFHSHCTKVSFGMYIKTIRGVELGGATSHTDEEAIEALSSGDTVLVSFKFKCCLLPGVYFMNAGANGYKDNRYTFLHRRVDTAMFRVLDQPKLKANGIVNFQIDASTEICSAK